MNRRLLNGDEVLPIIEDDESELEAAHRDEERGARIRANIQWEEEGEGSLLQLKAWPARWFLPSWVSLGRGWPSMVYYLRRRA